MCRPISQPLKCCLKNAPRKSIKSCGRPAQPVHLTLYQTTKSLEWSKFKALADDKLNVNKKLDFVLGRVENIVEKGEDAGYQYFLLFPTMFSEALCFRVVKSRDCVGKSNKTFIYTIRTRS